ncbi:hypothetical protein OH807_40065 [Kitasatospora sp. NBC_01560]|uniref:hypothetical protein n=1 Tax=Kitasatospora sp. NBC_01560 TaxID=2975965 RepID=UPI0038672385
MSGVSGVVQAAASSTETDLFAVVAVALLAAPFALLVGGGWLLCRLLATRRWAELLRMPGAVALGAAGVAGCAYARGLFAIPGLDSSEACALLGHGDSIGQERLFPISEQCVVRGADSGVELVPGWVNPVVVIGLLVAVVAVAASAVQWTGRRRAARAFRSEPAWADAESETWRPVPHDR